MNRRAVLIMALLGAFAVIAVLAVAKIGPATMISDLLIWVFTSVGAILEGFIEAFSPWR